MGAFHLQKNLRCLGRARPFVTSSIRESRGRPGRLKDRERYGTGDKDEKSVNRTQISTGKTGLPFQEFRLFQIIFS